MNRLVLIAALAVAAYYVLLPAPGIPDGPAAPDTSSAPLTVRGNTVAFDDAFTNHRSNLQLEGQGTVVRVLADDNDGSRHQRFIVRLGSGRTLLVAHNIDLAKRIDTLRVGDTVAFYGEYEWNAKGGVMHWTHHDPQGRHSGGWIRHNGQTYQ